MSTPSPSTGARRPLRALALRTLALAALAAGLIACLPAPPAAARPQPPGGLADQLAPVYRGLHARRPRAHRAHAAAAKKLLVLVDLSHMRNRGAISGAEMQRYRSTYLQALHTLAHLSSTRHTELADVLANVAEIAAHGELTRSRLPALMLTVQRNTEWWSRDSLLSYGARVSFPGSRLVWEYYPGQGIELQWLATFGEANGYYLSGDHNEALEEVIEEALELATVRAGGIAWEYMFHFDGGSPPWTSGLAQGTAIQALARAAQRLHEPAYMQAAGRALSLFETPPPRGVRERLPEGGVEYLEYSFAPDEHILNGFIQAIIGLYDYAKIAGSQPAARLFAEGDEQARLEVPHYDTGAWSMYDQHTESDLGYHELLTEFLKNLCQRTSQGPPLPPIPPGGPLHAGEGASGSQEGPIPGDAIYCSTAKRFEADLHTPPVLKLLSHHLPAGARAGVMVSLSKIATVTITVHHGKRVVWTNTATVEGGRPRLLWVTPSHRGRYRIEVTAVDLAGNRASTSGRVRVGPRRRGRGRRRHG